MLNLSVFVHIYEFRPSRYRSTEFAELDPIFVK